MSNLDTSHRSVGWRRTDDPPTPHPLRRSPFPLLELPSCLFLPFFFKKKKNLLQQVFPFPYFIGLAWASAKHTHTHLQCARSGMTILFPSCQKHTRTHTHKQKKKNQKTNVKLAHQRFPYTLRQWLESKWLTVSVERLEAAGRQQEGCRCHWCATRLRRIDQRV